jgi:vacuolar-type H+-ATPase subunit E/Vma4
MPAKPPSPPPQTQDRRQAAISQAARHLYDAETALHTARQSGVGAWISAAYDRLSEALADHARAAAALQAGAESPS